MSLKVLIVDPDLHFAERAAAYLESHAHLTVAKASAIEAMAQIRHWSPDLIILAGEVAEKGLIKALYGTNPRPAVLLTEHMDQFARAWRVWQTGGDELLMKPVFRTSEFVSAIITALENAATGTRDTLARPVAASA